MTPEAWTFAGLSVTQLTTLAVVWIKTRGAGAAAKRAATSAAQIEKQTKPNSGSTLRDAVDRIEKGLADVRSDVGQVHKRVDRLYERWGTGR